MRGFHSQGVGLLPYQACLRSSHSMIYAWSVRSGKLLACMDYLASVLIRRKMHEEYFCKGYLVWKRRLRVEF